MSGSRISKVEDAIEELARRKDISRLEVIRRAVALYELVYHETSEYGLKLALVDKDGTVKKHVAVR